MSIAFSSVPTISTRSAKRSVLSAQRSVTRQEAMAAAAKSRAMAKTPRPVSTEGMTK